MDKKVGDLNPEMLLPPVVLLLTMVTKKNPC